jgi:hypothetical protein
MNYMYTKRGAVTAEAIIIAATLVSAVVLLSSTTLQSATAIGAQSTGAGAVRAPHQWPLQEIIMSTLHGGPTKQEMMR